MARNKIADVRDHLFAQLERLGDEELDQEQLSKEVNRAKAITHVSSQIIQSAKVEVDYLRTIGAHKTNSELFKDVVPQNQIEG